MSRLITRGVVLTLGQGLCTSPRSAEATAPGKAGEAAPEGSNAVSSSPPHSMCVHTRSTYTPTHALRKSREQGHAHAQALHSHTQAHTHA